MRRVLAVPRRRDDGVKNSASLLHLAGRQECRCPLPSEDPASPAGGRAAAGRLSVINHSHGRGGPRVRLTPQTGPGRPRARQTTRRVPKLSVTLFRVSAFLTDARLRSYNCQRPFKLDTSF